MYSECTPGSPGSPVAWTSHHIAPLSSSAVHGVLLSHVQSRLVDHAASALVHAVFILGCRISNIAARHDTLKGHRPWVEDEFTKLNALAWSSVD